MGAPTVSLLAAVQPSFWEPHTQLGQEWWQGQPTHHALALMLVAQGESSCRGSLHRLLVITIVGVLKHQHREFWCYQLGAGDPVSVKSASSSS